MFVQSSLYIFISVINPGKSHSVVSCVDQRQKVSFKKTKTPRFYSEGFSVD